MMESWDKELDRLRRENILLRNQNAQLQLDIADLSAEGHRLRQERERLHGRRAATRPNPLGGGQ